MNLSNVFTNATKFVKLNSPQILTAFSVGGLITTSYLIGKASFEASEMIRKEESKGGTADDPKQRLKERAQLTWKLYIPAGIVGISTAACIVGASRAGMNRTAAAVTAYSLSEKAFSEYKEKVVEQIGKGKEQKIRDEIAQDRVLAKSTEKQVIVGGSGGVLCCELHTHRYFRSTMETLRKAQNDINAKIVKDLYVTLDEFYDILGLSHTTTSNSLGWDSNKLMELDFSTVLSEDGEPCLAFEYSYLKPL